jgi:hypothetical protein
VRVAAEKEKVIEIRIGVGEDPNLAPGHVRAIKLRTVAAIAEREVKGDPSNFD